MAVATPSFTGFRPEAIQFLVDLAANNERAWFQPRKAEYERLLKEPLEALIAALGERFETRGIPLRADPAKSPVPDLPRRPLLEGQVAVQDERRRRASRGLATAADAGDATARSHTSEVHSSGGYFHLQPGEIYVGGGIWHPDKPWLDAFRRHVADDPKAFHAVVDRKAFVDAFGGLSSDGHSLQRVPAGYAADHPEAETLKMKDVVFGRRLSDHEAMSPHLPDVMAETFEAAMPMFRYLATIG